MTRIWDVRSSRQLSTLGPAGPVTYAAFADADRQVVTQGSDGRVRRWQSGRAESVAIACGGAVVALALGSAHDAVAACADGRVHVVGARGGPVPPIVTSGAFRTAAISITGRVVAGIGADGRLSLVGLQDNSVVNVPGNWASVGVRTGGDTLDLLARDGTAERLVLASRKPSDRVTACARRKHRRVRPHRPCGSHTAWRRARIVVRSNGTLVRALPVDEVGRIVRGGLQPARQPRRDAREHATPPVERHTAGGSHVSATGPRARWTPSTLRPSARMGTCSSRALAAARSLSGKPAMALASASCSGKQASTRSQRIPRSARSPPPASMGASASSRVRPVGRTVRYSRSLEADSRSSPDRSRKAGAELTLPA